jgi:membrane-associated phospholipid phosphatase
MFTAGHAKTLFSVAIGSHHLEYGFPSTHSTNSVSIALFFLSHLRRLTYPPPPYPPTISPETYTMCIALLAWYAFSIVFGRLYTGMHGFSDCAMGVLLGAGIWAIHEGVGGWVELWVEQTGWAGLSAHIFVA